MGVADPGEGRVPLEYQGTDRSVIIEKIETVAEVFTHRAKYNGKRVREPIGVFEDNSSTSSAYSTRPSVCVASVASSSPSTPEH